MFNTRSEIASFSNRISTISVLQSWKHISYSFDLFLEEREIAAGLSTVVYYDQNR